ISGTDKNRMNLDHHDLLNFFNPKFGISFQASENHGVYASLALANKEPNRDDYINATPAGYPNHEKLTDFEAGYRFRNPKLTAGFNGYAMLYKDQLVLTGKINDVGEYIRQNVDKSYRLGLEADVRWQLKPGFSWALSAAVSSNKIRKFTEYIDDYDNSWQLSNEYDDTDLAFSPSFIGSSELAYFLGKRLELALLSKYVGKQYLDNTSNDSRKLNAFFINDLRLRFNTRISSLKNIGLT